MTETWTRWLQVWIQGWSKAGTCLSAEPPSFGADDVTTKRHSRSLLQSTSESLGWSCTKLAARISLAMHNDMVIAEKNQMDNDKQPGNSKMYQSGLFFSSDMPVDTASFIANAKNV
jgi:hypothetical protein